MAHEIKTVYNNCSSLNFGLLENPGYPMSIEIVFLYKSGSDNMNFSLCVMAVILPIQPSLVMQIWK